MKESWPVMAGMPCCQGSCKGTQLEEIFEEEKKKEKEEEGRGRGGEEEEEGGGGEGKGKRKEEGKERGRGREKEGGGEGGGISMEWALETGEPTPPRDKQPSLLLMA